MEKKAIVVGASSGIGAALGRELAARGYRVSLLARRLEVVEALAGTINEAEGRVMAFAHGHDAARADSVAPAFEQCLRELGSLDMVIYCAGVMPEVGPEEFDFEKDRRIFETNTLGAVHWLNHAAAHFQRKGAGSLVGISSVAGDRGRRGNPAYCASKAALNTYLESLRNRLRIKGVGVTTIKPGFIDTPMTQGKSGLFWLISAQEAARQIIEAAERKRNTVYVPWKWRWMMWVIRCIPSFVFKRLSI